jgi:hypothetical protein
VTVDAPRTPRHGVQTLADGYAQGEDNFLLLRFIAAALVIYGHPPAVGGDATLAIFLRAFQRCLAPPVSPNQCALRDLVFEDNKN